jgi:hypothetical protein
MRFPEFSWRLTYGWPRSCPLLIEAEDNIPPEIVRPCNVQKLIHTLKLRKACGIDGIPKDCLRHLSRSPLVHLTHLFNHCFRLSYFPSSWKEAKMIALVKDPKFPQNLRPISLLSITGKPSEKVIKKQSKGTLKLKSCYMLVSLALVHVTAQYSNV